MVRGEGMFKFFKYWFRELKTLYIIEALIYVVFTIGPISIDTRLSVVLNSLVFAIIVYTNVLFDAFGIDGMFTSKGGRLINSVPISSARIIMYKTAWMLLIQGITFGIGFTVSFVLLEISQDNSMMSLFMFVAATVGILLIIIYGVGSIGNIIALRIRCKTKSKLVEGVVSSIASFCIVAALFRISSLVGKVDTFIEFTGDASGFGFKMHSTPTAMIIFISLMVIVLVVLINIFGKTLDKKLDIL